MGVYSVSAAVLALVCTAIPRGRMGSSGVPERPLHDE